MCASFFNCFICFNECLHRLTFTITCVIVQDVVTYYMGNGWSVLDTQTFFLDKNDGTIKLTRVLDDASVNNVYTVGGLSRSVVLDLYLTKSHGILLKIYKRRLQNTY